MTRSITYTPKWVTITVNALLGAILVVASYGILLALGAF